MNKLSLLFVALTIAASTNSTHAQQYGHLENWTSDQPLASDTNFEQAWKIKIGFGRSQIVTDQKRAFVVSGEHETRKGKPALIRNRLQCLDLATGENIWKRESEPTEMYESQETFSGAPASPRATPALIGGALVTASFTGILECVEADSGELRWKKDLVADLRANPVQFGFSASPVGDGVNPDRVYITAAGPKGGLHCLSLKDGSQIWTAGCETASYATPTFATFDGVRQLLVVTEDEVLGINVDNGLRLWNHELSEPDMTNVPSPIVLPNGFILSGQGCKGTCRIDVARNGDQWKTQQKWYNKKAQLFYSNWLLAQPNIVIGCDNRMLMAFDVENGSTLGRWRGFADGNLIRFGKSILIVDGKGTLNLLSSQLMQTETPALTQLQKIPVLKARCWTPATPIENGMLLRGDDELTLIRFSKNADKAIQNNLRKPKTLALKQAPANTATEDIDFVEAIFETFEKEGANAALTLYNKLRTQKPSPLSADDRVALITAARGQGLDDVANLILNHALKDFPNSDELRELAKESK